MKTINSYLKKTLLVLCLSMLTNCQEFEGDLLVNEQVESITKDSKVVQLMIEAASRNSLQKSATTETKCTGFKYDLTFNAYYGDNTKPTEILVHNDEQLLDFFNTTLTPENQFFIHFPVSLTDANGDITVIESLKDLEGTLQIALDLCNGTDDDDEDEYEYCDSKKKKVYICHKGKTICVSVNAIWGHLNQHEEDFLGRCD